MAIYDYSVKKANGEVKRLSDYKDKVVLIVNTATRCTYTEQYKGLQELYNKYHDKGLEILDFPCNQFANQAPETDEEIDKFCKEKYNTTFDRFAKINVNGKNADPLYTYLKNEVGGFLSKNIKWNFTKFLVNRNGIVVGRFAPNVKPEKLERKIRQALL